MSNDVKIKNSGFTLLETLIAIAVLALAVIGPLTLASRSISAVSVSQNQIAAFYLGQEAIEYVRNKRDTNFLEGRDWLEGLSPCWNSNGCYVDIPNDNIGNVSSYNDCPDKAMKYDDVNGRYYNYDDGECTVFARTVKITRNVGDNQEEAGIEVTITWQDKSRQKTLILEENIFDWK